MLQQKRIRKPPQPLTLLYPVHSERPRPSKAKKKVKRCSYQMIPYPNKFIYSTKIFHLCTDIVILEANGTLYYEPSLLNRFMKYEEIKIVPTPIQKLVRIITERRKGAKVLSWSQIVKKLKATRDTKMIEWSNLIKKFCEKHESAIEVEDHIDPPQSAFSDSRLCQVKPEHETRQNELMTGYPCIFFRSGFSNGKLGISEIVLTEKFVEAIEYQLDEFASIVLENGIPQLMPYESETNTQILKVLLENYFRLEGKSFQSQEFESCLYTKNGYVKNITLQVHLFPTTFEEREGVDQIITINKIEHPSSNSHYIPKSRINRNYAERSLALSKETNYFLSTYYHEFIPTTHVNPEKVCGIRELEPFSEDEDDFSVKVEQIKYEDLDFY